MAKYHGPYEIIKVDKEIVQGKFGPYTFVDLKIGEKVKEKVLFGESQTKNKDGERWQNWPVKKGDKIKVNQSSWEKGDDDYGPSIKTLEQGAISHGDTIDKVLVNVLLAAEKETDQEKLSLMVGNIDVLLHAKKQMAE